jgi:hypothetical protein
VNLIVSPILQPGIAATSKAAVGSGFVLFADGTCVSIPPSSCAAVKVVSASATAVTEVVSVRASTSAFVTSLTHPEAFFS